MAFASRSIVRGALAALLLASGSAGAATVSPNTGSLGSAADGVNADAVTFGPGAVNVPGDEAAVYNGVGGTRTTVQYNPALNPAAASPFSVEFWARPTATDNDDAPVSNRVASGNRSGWVFFQRAAGWNFRMYNGNAGNTGWDLTGGTSPLDEWSHVVATWDGAAARLFVNGALADDANDPSNNGVYNPNPAATSGLFLVANSDTGSPYTGAVDEVAFYGAALTPEQILGHFTAAGAAPGTYHNLVRADGALLQLSNVVPEPTALGMVGIGAMMFLRRRARDAQAK
jgi:hypothetical protein